MRPIFFSLFSLFLCSCVVLGDTASKPELVFTNVSGDKMRIVVDYLAEKERIYRGEFLPGARLRVPHALPIAIQFSHGEFLQIGYAGGTIPHSIKGMGTLVIDFSENGVIAREANPTEKMILARELMPAKSVSSPSTQEVITKKTPLNAPSEDDYDLSYLNPILKEIEKLDLNPVIEKVSDYHVIVTKRLIAMAKEKEFVDMLAAYKRQLYESLIASGFSEEEALEIVIRDTTLTLLINYGRHASTLLEK